MIIVKIILAVLLTVPFVLFSGWLLNSLIETIVGKESRRNTRKKTGVRRERNEKRDIYNS